MITVDLVNPLFYHIRQKERCIGVDFDSEHIKALYGLLEDLAQEEIAKLQLATELKARIDTMKNRMKQIMMKAKVAKDKRPLLNEAMQIQDDIALAVAMLEHLDNG